MIVCILLINKIVKEAKIIKNSIHITVINPKPSGSGLDIIKSGLDNLRVLILHFISHLSKINLLIIPNSTDRPINILLVCIVATNSSLQ